MNDYHESKDGFSVNGLDTYCAEKDLSATFAGAQEDLIDVDSLSGPSKDTHTRKTETEQQKTVRLTKISGAVRMILECLGEKPERGGLVATPDRYAKALIFFTKGYEEDLHEVVNGAIFNEEHHELVIVKDIEISSLCEHHLVPFTGKVHIGYIPNGKVIGLSKLSRIAEMFSRRLQVQERLTKEIAAAISEILQPQGVAVVMQCRHLCMEMRGVQKIGTTTGTSCMLGCMESSAESRKHFFALMRSM